MEWKNAMCKIQHPKQPCNFSWAPWWTLRPMVWGWYFGKVSQNKAEGALADLDFQSILTEDCKGQIWTQGQVESGGLISSSDGNCFQNKESLKATPKPGAHGPADCFPAFLSGHWIYGDSGHEEPKTQQKVSQSKSGLFLRHEEWTDIRTKYVHFSSNLSQDGFLLMWEKINIWSLLNL